MFDDYFEVFLADTDEGRRVHYNIRYQVYCQELAYEDPKKFPNQLEMDRWDRPCHQARGSVPFLVRLKHSGEWIGAMRLVFSDKHHLPLQDFCAVESSVNTTDIEISRLCLVKNIRKSYESGEIKLTKNFSSNINYRNLIRFSNPTHVKSTIIWGLFNAALHYSLAHHLEHWYLLSSRSFARLIRSKGFKIEQVGSVCQHRGSRFPFRFTVEEIKNSSVWEQFNSHYRLFSDLSWSEFPAQTDTELSVQHRFDLA